jgi:hypothetical protein
MTVNFDRHPDRSDRPKRRQPLACMHRQVLPADLPGSHVKGPMAAVGKGIQDTCQCRVSCPWKEIVFENGFS